MQEVNVPCPAQIHIYLNKVNTLACNILDSNSNIDDHMTKNNIKIQELSVSKGAIHQTVLKCMKDIVFCPVYSIHFP